MNSLHQPVYLLAAVLGSLILMPRSLPMYSALLKMLTDCSTSTWGLLTPFLARVMRIANNSSACDPSLAC